MESNHTINTGRKKFYLSIIITQNCNLSCSYCYEMTKSNRTIELSLAKSIIKEYLNSEQYDEVEIDLFGGEPFLEFEKIKELCEWTWNQKWKNAYLFFTTSNGVLIHGKIREWLRINKDRFWVSLSIDGERYSHNINRSNSFDLIDIPFFKECWPMQSVKMTISKDTISYLYDNIVYLHSFGFELAGTNFAEGINWGGEELKTILIDQLDKLCRYYIENPNVKPAPIVNMPIHYCEMEKTKKKTCGCGVTMAAYGIDGEKYPCTFFTSMTFSDEKLKIIDQVDWDEEDFFTDDYCYNNCYLNPICFSCYGSNMLQTGNVNVRDKSRCELIKIRAVFSAVLVANRIINNPEDNQENYLSAKAIKKINSLFNNPSNN